MPCRSFEYGNCAIGFEPAGTSFGDHERQSARLRGPHGGIALVESQLTDNLTAKLAGRAGITLVDRASIDQIIKEQNFQNSDRSSPDTAARIGKLLGVGQIVLVQVVDGSYTQHNDTAGNTTQTIGTVVLRADARLIDVETAVILAEPTASFQDSVQVSEVSRSQGFQIGAYRVPPKTTAKGGDPTVIQHDEWVKAEDSVVGELAGKLTGALANAPLPTAAPALVAGIANGSVYINEGSTAGVKAGDRFQVTREVSVGLTDPATGKPIVQKQQICVLTIVNVDETNSSGSCDGRGCRRRRDHCVADAAVSCEARRGAIQRGQEVDPVRARKLVARIAVAGALLAALAASPNALQGEPAPGSGGAAEKATGKCDRNTTPTCRRLRPRTTRRFTGCTNTRPPFLWCISKAPAPFASISVLMRRVPTSKIKAMEMCISGI